jgi:hypothetical protein
LTDDAKARWEEIYNDLAFEHGGLVDSLTSRAEPYVLRIAMIHAVQTGERSIDVVHLNAAFALWKYCEESVSYVFWGLQLSKNEKKLIGKLKAEGEVGIARTGIHAVFNRHVNAFDLDKMIDRLEAKGLVKWVESRADGQRLKRLVAN